MKKCTKCGNEYPATNDYFHKRNRNGKTELIAQCKVCRNVLRKTQTIKGLIRKCLYCDKEFSPRENNIYCCSKSCGIRAKHGRTPINDLITILNDIKDKKDKQEQLNKICAVCGKNFIGYASICSDECRKAYNRQYTREHAAVKKEAKQYICVICEQSFKTPYGNKKRSCCSELCQKKLDRLYKRTAKATRRARVKHAFVENINIKKLYKRDNGICGICGEYVDYSLTAPHLMCATIDHIHPLSKGGLHEYKNAQLAHFICNSVKCDKIMCATT